MAATITREATVQVAATLTVPYGRMNVRERQVVHCCTDCATFLLTKQYVPTWDWDDMAPSTVNGHYGWCYTCPDTAARRKHAA